MSSTVVAVAILLYAALNVAALFYLYRRDRKRGVAALDADRKRMATSLDANRKTPTPRPEKVIVCAATHRMALVWADSVGYRPNDLAICTTGDHLRGRSAETIVFLDYGWDQLRTHRGQMAMLAEIVVSKRGGRVEYWPEVI